MLQRRLSLLQAVSLNMAMMVGIGPFITIPQLVGALGGPQAMVAWILGAIVALADGLVWSELAAAFPGSGGTYHFFDAIYGNSRLGRMLKFLFVWQFLFSAPLEIASGAIGLMRYAGFFWPILDKPVWTVIFHAPFATSPLVWTVRYGQVGAMAILAFMTALAYRRIEVAGRFMVVLWVGMLATMVWVIAAGFSHFDLEMATAVPAGAWDLDGRFVFGLGEAMAIAMYAYLGYYQVCYLGDEIADAPRTIPRSIVISLVFVAAAYVAMTLGILGTIPWREVVGSQHVVSDLMLRLYGHSAARFVTVMIAWTALAGCFAALLGYSRVPYASARAGHFFRVFAKTHPIGDFPHRSLLLVAGLAIVSCLAELELVIAALLTSRILIQFVGQIATTFYLRTRSDLYARMPFRMRLFPLPGMVALLGWLFVFSTSDRRVIAYGLGSLVFGLATFLLWDRRAARNFAVDGPSGG